MVALHLQLAVAPIFFRLFFKLINIVVRSRAMWSAQRSRLVNIQELC